VLDLHAEPLAVEGERLVEILDRDTDVIEPFEHRVRTIRMRIFQENTDCSRRAWGRFIAGDTEGVLEWLHEDIEVHDLPELPGAGVHHGHDGFLAQIEGFREAFAEMDCRALERIDCGEQVVTVIEADATAAASGIERTFTYAQLETWRDGKIAAIRYFTEKEGALEAAAC
jgi:ketosteroid isomerase-like protein